MESSIIFADEHCNYPYLPHRHEDEDRNGDESGFYSMHHQYHHVNMNEDITLLKEEEEKKNFVWLDPWSEYVYSEMEIDQVPASPPLWASSELDLKSNPISYANGKLSLEGIEHSSSSSTSSPRRRPSPISIPPPSPTTRSISISIASTFDDGEDDSDDSKIDISDWSPSYSYNPHMYYNSFFISPSSSTLDHPSSPPEMFDSFLDVLVDDYNHNFNHNMSNSLSSEGTSSGYSIDEWDYEVMDYVLKGTEGSTDRRLTVRNV